MPLMDSQFFANVTKTTQQIPFQPIVRKLDPVCSCIPEMYDA
ncbi:hypothetical protein A2U01_0098960, partial [Trifolium medium]|nr:hypothetical protein [Trifolium medium]